MGLKNYRVVHEMYNLISATKVNSAYSVVKSKLTHVKGYRNVMLRKALMRRAMHAGWFTEHEHAQWKLSQRV